VGAKDADGDREWVRRGRNRPLGDGGALVILSPDRANRWASKPPTLTGIPAVMGSQLPDESIQAFNASAQRTMTRGEIGIVLSNVMAWRHALEAGWEWALVLEDDARLLRRSSNESENWNVFLSSLPSIVEAAKHHMSDWQLIVLNPINQPHDFMACVPCAKDTIPHLMTKIPHMRAGRLEVSVSVAPGSGWHRCPPTVHAFGWIYRRPLMEQLVHSFETNFPRHDVHDIWVWEVMAYHKVISSAMCPRVPLVGQMEGKSVKDMQDSDGPREAIWAQRGHREAIERELV